MKEIRTTRLIDGGQLRPVVTNLQLHRATQLPGSAVDDDGFSIFQREGERGLEEQLDHVLIIRGRQVSVEAEILDKHRNSGDKEINRGKYRPVPSEGSCVLKTRKPYSARMQ